MTITYYPPPRKLADLVVGPHVNARFDLKRDKNGYYLPRSSAIDICGRGFEAYDADIRGVGPDGIERFYYSGCETIAWEDVQSITVRAIDENGFTKSQRTFAPDFRMVRAA